MTRLAVLMYHDVVPAGQFDRSGFQGDHADHYKLTTTAFEQHLAAILQATKQPPGLLPQQHSADSAPPVLLTFDDGGVSALTEIAPRLEACSARGYFFVTSDWIGQSGFLDADQLRELDSRGHVIGSHTCSHPARISALRPAELRREWVDSRRRLEELLGHPVTVASIPGGYYSRAVAAAAGEAGYSTLLTSEPTLGHWQVNGCRMLGRFAITRQTPAEAAAALATGDPAACRRQWFWWNARKTAKRLSGPLYEPVRRALLKLARPAPASTCAR